MLRTPPKAETGAVVLYLQLVYRRFHEDAEVEEVVLDLVMRCYYADELLDLVRGHGLEGVASWEGNADERPGAGSEVVIQFARPRCA